MKPRARWEFSSAEPPRSRSSPPWRRSKSNKINSFVSHVSAHLYGAPKSWWTKMLDQWHTSRTHSALFRGAQMQKAPWILAVILLVGGCSKEEPVTKVPVALSERRALQAAPATRLRLGEDCGSFGSAGCLTGICLKTGGELDRGFICSQTCSSSAPCPVGYSCEQVRASEGGSLCLPVSKTGVDGGAP